MSAALRRFRRRHACHDSSFEHSDFLRHSSFVLRHFPGALRAVRYPSILARCRFTSPRLRFDSRIFLLSADGRGDFRRRSFSRTAIRARRAARCRSSIAVSNRSRASLRFCACDRESCTVTLIPDGKCRSVTAVATLLTFWPPGPDERAKVSFRSASRIPMRCMRWSSDKFIDQFFESAGFFRDK